MATDRDARTGATEGPSTRRRGGSSPPAREQRLRPAPTSALSPSPGSLMPVPTEDAGGADRGDGRAGRRQHHRAPNGRGTPEPGNDLVYLSGRIPRRLRDELHVRAIGEGRPVVDLMRDALRGYLDQHGGGPSQS